MVESDETLTCSHCRKSGNFTAPVSVILVFAPGLTKPYPVLLCGSPGSGKTFFVKEFAKTVGADPATIANLSAATNISEALQKHFLDIVLSAKSDAAIATIIEPTIRGTSYLIGMGR